MRNCWFVVLLFSSLVVAQTAAPSGQKPTLQKPPAPPAAGSTTQQQPAPAHPPAANVPTVADSTPVITLTGVCEKKPNLGEICKTVVTRAEFDRFLDALNPGATLAALPAATKRTLAQNYAKLLILSINAQNRDLQNQPRTQELLKFSRIQALAQALSNELQQLSKPTPDEMQRFYQENQDKLKQITLERIFVPAKTDEAGKQPDEAAAKAATDKIRQRALAGEDFAKLQREVFQTAGMQNSPETKMVVFPANLPATQQTILDLKPNQISQAYSEPSGYFIYKMISMAPIPFDKVKPEIEQKLQQDKFKASLDGILNSTTPALNESYFGPAPTQNEPYELPVLPTEKPSPKNTGPGKP